MGTRVSSSTVPLSSPASLPSTGCDGGGRGVGSGTARAGGCGKCCVCNVCTGEVCAEAESDAGGAPAQEVSAAASLCTAAAAAADADAASIAAADTEDPSSSARGGGSEDPLISGCNDIIAGASDGSESNFLGTDDLPGGASGVEGRPRVAPRTAIWKVSPIICARPSRDSRSSVRMPSSSSSMLERLAFGIALGLPTAETASSAPQLIDGASAPGSSLSGSSSVSPSSTSAAAVASPPS